MSWLSKICPSSCSAENFFLDIYKKILNRTLSVIADFFGNSDIPTEHSNFSRLSYHCQTESPTLVAAVCAEPC